ncbi:hypothetical protein Ancab_007533 [Ancistrocladus abbreviatus]
MTEERKPPSPPSPPSPKRRNLEEGPPSPLSYLAGGSQGRDGGSSSSGKTLPIQVHVSGEGSGQSVGGTLEEEKARTCSICQKVFSSVKGMYGHLWVHSNRSRPPERQPHRGNLIRAQNMFEDIEDSELEGEEESDPIIDQTQTHPFDLNNPAEKKAKVLDLNKSPPTSSTDDEESGNNGARSK